MKTLIIYDNDGIIINQQYGDYKIPKGIPYVEVEIPTGKYAVSVNAENKEVVYKEIEKSEIEVIQGKISILEAENESLKEGLRAVLRGDMQSLAYILYPEDFNTFQKAGV